jgi:hypothetical protein
VRKGSYDSIGGFNPEIDMSIATPGKGLAPKALYRWLPFVTGTMSLLDGFRQEYVDGMVVDKYRLGNGNLGLIVKDAATDRCYHVEFKDNYTGASTENLFGLLKEPFAGKTEYLDKLIREGDNIDLMLSYSRGPFREAYYLHSVSRSNAGKTPHQIYRKLIEQPYTAGRAHGYL